MDTSPHTGTETDTADRWWHSPWMALCWFGAGASALMAGILAIGLIGVLLGF